MSNLNRIGFQDVPVDDEKDESLGLGVYADSLAEFIVRCGTPMTIALQGDWGSGKTSLMKIIRAKLTKLSEDKIYPIWVDTWQFSQFDLQNELAVSFLSRFLELLSNESSQAPQLLLRIFGKAGKVGVKFLADHLGGKAAEGFTEKVLEKLAGVEVDPAQRIAELKDKIAEAVNAKIQKDKLERIVVFVDDLDRLMPERAVEVLEAIKLFLDIPGCVFVLAIDYQVVVKGVEKKFGIGTEQEKGKDFFDKIIQLPFNMPIGQYEAKKYINTLLGQLNQKLDDTNLDQYQALIETSVGFNPRSIKRLLNSLLLLRLVAQRKKVTMTADQERVLFAILCLQAAFEPIYHYLQSQANTLSGEVLGKFTDVRNFEQGSEDQENLPQDILAAIQANTRMSPYRLAKFMKVFFNSMQIQAEGDMKSLSSRELENLKNVLRLSSLTSVDDKEQMNWENRRRNRAVVVEINRLMTEKTKDLLDAFLPDGYLLYQSNTREDAVSYICFEIAKGSSAEITCMVNGNEMLISFWKHYGSAQSIVNWSGKVPALTSLDRYYLTTEGYPAWGWFTVDSNEGSIAEQACEHYAKVVEVVAAALRATR